MKKNSSSNFWVLGLQFTSSILAPLLVCIFGGMYLQEKYELGDWVMLVSIALGAFLVFSSMVSMSKMLLRMNDKKNSMDDDQKDKTDEK